MKTNNSKAWRVAQNYLTSNGLDDAWRIFKACYDPDPGTLEGTLRLACAEGDEIAKLALRDYFLDQGVDPDAQPMLDGHDEQIIVGITNQLIAKGRLSDRQIKYLHILVKHISDRPTKRDEKAAQQAKWAQERAEAPDVPEGLQTVDVTVIKAIYHRFSLDGSTSNLALTCKADAGYLLWGEAPLSIANEDAPLPIKGTRIRLTATLKRSKKDPKFGIFTAHSAVVI